MDTITRAEAKAEGMADYFTGKPCPKGHVAKRKTTNGECRECARLYAEAKHDLKRNDFEYRAKNAARANAHYARKEEPKRAAKRALAEAAGISHPHLTVRSRTEALALSLPRYFLGRPCPNGHVSERETGDRACIECKRAETARWRSKNKDAIRDYNTSYYQSDLEGQRKRSRDWHHAQRDNPVIKEKNRKRSLAWYYANPEKAAVRTNRRRARKLVAGGSHTAADLRRIRALQKDRCAYCRVDLAGAGHLDHIEPLAKGGTNAARNLQYLCEPCNRRKQAADPIDFAQSIGLLL